MTDTASQWNETEISNICYKKFTPYPIKKWLPVDARSVCNSWDSTITPHKPGISSVVADSVDRRTVDLVSSTSPGNNPAAHCSRDSVSPRRSREGICKYGPKTMHEILTFTNFGVQNPKSGNQSRPMLISFNHAKCHLRLVNALLLWKKNLENAKNAENLCCKCSFVPFWQAQLGVRSAKRRHQSPEWTILSHVNCFVQREVFGFQVPLDSLHPCSTRASWWSPPVLRGGSC